MIRTSVARRRPPGPFADSGLHLGHARTFLIAWLAARSTGGRVILRIEDLDASRVRDDARAAALVDLRWLGLDWDEGPYVQSDRRALYDDALDRLKAAEQVYPCTCTRADIERAAAPAPRGRRSDVSRHLRPSPRCRRRRRSAIARSPGGSASPWLGRLGRPVPRPLRIDPARLGGDFVVGRNTLGPSYQLAVVVDDALMGVTQVVRGADLVPSTPRQILLYKGLGWTPPRFGHVPLVLGPDGRRLAKRDGSIKLATLREQGVDPRRLIAALARSCGWTTTLNPSRPSDWIDRYNPEFLPNAPWIMNPDEWRRPAANLRLIAASCRKIRGASPRFALLFPNPATLKTRDRTQTADAPISLPEGRLNRGSIVKTRRTKPTAWGLASAFRRGRSQFSSGLKVPRGGRRPSSEHVLKSRVNDGGRCPAYDLLHVRAPMFSPNEAIYERRFVKRGGCGFRGGGVLVQTVRRRLRSPAHPGPGRGRIRARPARRPPSPRPREGGALPLQTPVVRDAWADATCSLNHLFGIAGRAGVAISLVSKGRLHSIARRSAGAAVRVRCGVVLWSSRPPAVARRSALSHTC